MTNGNMPSGEMLQPDTRSSLNGLVTPNLTEAIQALEKLNRQQINLLRQIVSSLDTTGDLSTLSAAEAEDSVEVSSIGVQSTTGNTASRGLEAAKQVQNLGFVEFTAGLINGTFDAIVGATVKQMEAYAQLVADLSKSIQQFQAENVSDADITEHLTNRYPDGEGSTSVRPNYIFQDTMEDTETGATAKLGKDRLQDTVRALIDETKGLSKNLKLTRTNLGIAEDAMDIQFNQEQVTLIRTSIASLLATNMIAQLREMARDGMARIVITDGEIMTKLTFNITTTELQEKEKQNYNKNVNKTKIGGGGRGLWWRVKASTDNTNININSMNEKSFDSTTMSTEMIGQVKIRFKTESFPPYVPSTAPEETTETTQ